MLQTDELIQRIKQLKEYIEVVQYPGYENDLNNLNTIDREIDRFDDELLEIGSELVDYIGKKAYNTANGALANDDVYSMAFKGEIFTKINCLKDYIKDVDYYFGEYDLSSLSQIATEAAKADNLITLVTLAEKVNSIANFAYYQALAIYNVGSAR